MTTVSELYAITPVPWLLYPFSVIYHIFISGFPYLWAIVCRCGSDKMFKKCHD